MPVQEPQHVLLADGRVVTMQQPQLPSWTGRYTSRAGRWFYWLGMGWGAAHLALLAAIYFTMWVTFSPRRVLLFAGLVWVLVAWHPWG